MLYYFAFFINIKKRQSEKINSSNIYLMRNLSTAATFRKYKQTEYKNQISHRRQNSTKGTPNYLGDSTQPITVPRGLKVEDTNNLSEICLFTSRSQNSEQKKKAALRNMFSRDKIYEINKKCKQTRSHHRQSSANNPECLANPKTLKIFVDYQGNILDQKQSTVKNMGKSRMIFTPPKSSRSTNKSNVIDFNKLQGMITTLSQAPVHNAQRSALIKSLASQKSPMLTHKKNKMDESKLFKRNSLNNSSNFKTSIKPKNSADNPNIFVNILKRKMLIMETKDVHKYIIRLAKQMNA